MLPSRGLRPNQLTSLTSRQPTALCSNASRKYSSLPRTASLSAPSSRSGLQSANWRAGATSRSHIVLNESSVRYASWYAPWSWSWGLGKSGAPGTTETVAIGEFSNQHPQPTATAPEPNVTTTPDIATQSIDNVAATQNATHASAETTSAAIGTSETLDQRTIDEVLAQDPTRAPATEHADPSELINHAGHLKELGLDYGWGMTTTFESLLETIYLQSGWGWAGSIMATTLAVRCGLFVFQAYNSHNMAGMAAMKPITQPIQEKLNLALERGDKEQSQLYRMQLATVMKPYMGGTLASMGFVFVQMWVGFSAFRFLRAMGDMPVPGLSQDGFLWFTDMTMHDPYYVLPVATSSAMYLIFKKGGGETGVQDQVGQAGMGGVRSGLMTAMALGMGVFTCWQPAALQLYFMTSATLGGLTGLALRQNSFRNLIGIRALPTAESNELFSKVAAGKMKLSDIKGPDGKIRYQAPRVTSSSSPSTRSLSVASSDFHGINLKAGAAIPAHMRPEAPKKENIGLKDRDHDYDEGAKGSLSEKLDYYRRNYKMAYIQRRFAKGARNMMKRAGYDVDPVQSPEAARRKRRAEQYELERKRRFQNRK